ncbi:MAG: TonB-dependent receptor plug domain-containing protein, partial [bacterium]
MKLEIAVTGQNKATITESPGIVTLITEDEIRESGARDLLDILRMVPGLDFGAELDNVIGFGVRGNNATEGKVLVLIDGQQMNETNYGSFPFGQHILPDNIKRIEIIRGPGSAIYGGMAELAVINIITRKGTDINGINISAEVAASESMMSRGSFQMATG